MFISNTDPVLLSVIIYAFGWTSIFSFIVLLFKWTDYWVHRTRKLARGRTESSKRKAASIRSFSDQSTHTTTALKFSAIICTIQNIFAVFITIIPGLAQIDQSNDPWVTILNVSSVISMPFHSFIPFQIVMQETEMEASKNAHGGNGAASHLISSVNTIQMSSTISPAYARAESHRPSIRAVLEQGSFQLNE
jgi:hypothetical protein